MADNPITQQEMQDLTDGFRRKLFDLAEEANVPVGAVVQACAETIIFTAFQMLEDDTPEGRAEIREGIRELCSQIADKVDGWEEDGSGEVPEDNNSTE